MFIFSPPNNIKSRSGIDMVVPEKVSLYSFKSFLKFTKYSWTLHALLKLFISCNFVLAKHIHSSISINAPQGSPSAVIDEFLDEQKKYFNYSSELQKAPLPLELWYTMISLTSRWADFLSSSLSLRCMGSTFHQIQTP